MKYNLAIICLVIIQLLSCKKFLEEKPNASFSTPETLQDMRSLLDYYGINTQFPGCAEVMTDNYYLLSASWSGLSKVYEREYYLWNPTDQNNIEWNNSYKHIFTCNLVLENVEAIDFPNNSTYEYNEIKKTALFFRASYFFSLLQLFAKTYVPATAHSDLGIPLRVTTSFEERVHRNTVAQCYNKIVSDLKVAASLLPPAQQQLKSRPSKAACFGALARTLLVMQEYEQASLYSDSCLMIDDRLMDFNLLNPHSNTPIPRFNEEVIFQALSTSAGPLSPRISMMDTLLYDSYREDDLRKVVFYINSGDNKVAFKGSYDGAVNNGNGQNFTGITTSEQYLIKAETLARLNKLNDAAETLDILLESRYKTDRYHKLSNYTKKSLIDRILSERRKELVFRNLRFSDIRRLNLEPERAIYLKRIINGETFEIEPNSDRYVSRIPEMAIKRSGMAQNP